MLLAPPTPTHAHEDRLPHHFSPPGSSAAHSPPSPNGHLNKRRSTSPHQSPMNEVSSHLTPAASCPGLTQRRASPPIIMPISSSGDRIPGGMGVPIPGSQSGPPVSSAGAFGALSAGGGPNSLPLPVGRTSAQTPPMHHPLLGYVPHGGNKILSRNLNGTLAVTSQPSNESELQLYRVLQRANLLNYYDTFISQGRVQGGDDVQQLCEAGEEEFLEIMALVGMASKPLHVRRLQKALQEWVSNPFAGFSNFGQRSLLSNSSTPSTRPSPPINTSSSLLHNHNNSPGKEIQNNNLGGGTSPRDGCLPNAVLSRDGIMGVGGGHGSRGPSPGIPPSSTHLNSTGGHLPPSTLPLTNSHSVLGAEKNPEFFLQIMKNAGCDSPGLIYPPPNGSPPMGESPLGGNSPQGITPTLHEAQIARLAQAASELVANMPSIEPRKDAFNKRKMSKELEMIMNMSDNDPRRMEEIRKYAAIYGRFDCKRKPEKPLTMHEVSVNEAAAQICKYMPALLTRRDELFPLARQVVRDSGYQYSKGHSRSVTQCDSFSTSETTCCKSTFCRSQNIIGREDEMRPKRSRLDSGPDIIEYKQDSQWKKRHERLENISDELRAMSEKAEDVRISLTSGTGNIADLTQQMDVIHTRHAQLTLEQNELMKAQQKSFLSRPRSERSCSDDTRADDSDSYSYSANNSPSQVISSSQGNIIAVANPALSLSSAIPSNHVHLMDRDDDRPIYSISKRDEDRTINSIYSNNHSSRNNNNNSIKLEPNSPGANHKQE